MMVDFRANPPKAILGSEVVKINDFPVSYTHLIAISVTCKLLPVHNAVRKFSFASVRLSMFSTVGSAP